MQSLVRPETPVVHAGVGSRLACDPVVTQQALPSSRGPSRRETMELRPRSRDALTPALDGFLVVRAPGPPEFSLSMTTVILKVFRLPISRLLMAASNSMGG